MQVQCENCGSRFNLDNSVVPPDGAWVRCGDCQHVFQAMPGQPAPGPVQPGAEEQPSAPTSADDLLRLDRGIDHQREIDLIDQPGGGKASGSKRGCFFKTFFWFMGLVLVLAVILGGGLVTLDRLEKYSTLVDVFRSWPVLDGILGTDRAPAAREEDPTAHIVLLNPQVYYRHNQSNQRLFIIQGQVQNKGKQTVAEVLVAGLLKDKQDKTVHEAVIYAGPIFTSQELRELTLQEIQVRLGSSKGPDGSKYIVGPGATIPYMIVFADPPENLAKYHVEVKNAKLHKGEES